MRRRAQLVLVAAAVAALAFLPVVAAYLQLGYAGDAHAMAGRDRPGAAAVGALDRAVDLARPGLARNYSWPRRRSAVTAYRGALDSYRRHVERSRVDGGTGIVVTYDAAAAVAWAADSCPSGRGRVFGPCVADRGVVVQERDGSTAVVAVAFDVAVVQPRTRTNLSVVVRRDG